MICLTHNSFADVLCWQLAMGLIILCVFLIHQTCSANCRHWKTSHTRESKEMVGLHKPPSGKLWCLEVQCDYHVSRKQPGNRLRTNLRSSAMHQTFLQRDREVWRSDSATATAAAHLEALMLEAAAHLEHYDACSGMPPMALEHNLCESRILRLSKRQGVSFRESLLAPGR